MARKKTLGLTSRIVIGMAAGLLLGGLFNSLQNAWVNEYLVSGVLEVISQVFVASLKMLVVPLVFVSLVCGVSSLGDIQKLGRIGGKTLGLYLFTTATAISLGLFFGNLIQPGAGFQLSYSGSFQAKEAPGLVQVLIDIFPTNPIRAMAEGKMLQVIVFSTLFGLAITMVGSAGSRIKKTFEDVNEVIMKIITMLMALAPYGVFALVAKVFAAQGFDAIAPLAKYFFLVIAVLILHATLTYGTVLKVLSGLSPIRFFKKMKSVVLFAFSTSSSNATIPLTMKTVEEKMGCGNSIASFTVPLGATINMDGTAIMQGVATVFISQAYGIEIGLSGYLMVILTATLASVGTAGVPGVGLITLAMVLRQVGLPVEGIALIIGVDRLIDMVRTAVNVCGDASVTCIVAKSEKQFDPRIWNKDLQETETLESAFPMGARA